VGSLDPAKILMILVVILIVLGPERLPKVARQLGAAWHEITRIRQEVTDEVRAVMPDLDLSSIPRIPSVRGTLTGLITEPTSAEKAAAAAAAPDADARDLAPADSIRPVLGDFSPPVDDPSMN
jgi:Sec-independent protein translocase protein TatA